MTLMLHEPFKTLWAGKDAFTEVERLSGKLFRDMPGRRTLRVEIADEAFFVKIHHGVGWREIFKNLLLGRLPVLGAGQEWRALARLAKANVPSMTVAAFGERGSNPARRQSFIITREIAPAVDLEVHTQGWKSSPPAFAEKRALISAVAETTRRMHQAGVNHRDCYLCHFLWLLENPAEKSSVLAGSPATFSITAPDLFLIDLHRAQVRAAVPRRWRDKDLSALYFSALGIGLTRRDLFRFLRVYFGRSLSEILRQEGALLLWLEKKGAALQTRFQKYEGRL